MSRKPPEPPLNPGLSQPNSPPPAVRHAAPPRSPGPAPEPRTAPRAESLPPQALAIPDQGPAEGFSTPMAHRFNLFPPGRAPERPGTGLAAIPA
ncbi:hypothetical protein GCM10010428_22260 [Actinosynnema pretiosum subsp. pretiosum]